MAIDLEKYRKATTTPATSTTPVDISKYKKVAPAPTPEPTSPLGSFAKSAYNLEKDVATGFAKGGTQTALGLGNIAFSEAGMQAQKLLPLPFRLMGKVAEKTGLSNIFNPSTQAGQKARQLVEPKNTAESVGKGIEQTAEFFIPAGAAMKGEKAVNVASKAISSPFLAATARIVGKSAVQGLSAGGVKYLQTGGDTKEAVKTGALGGLARGAMATIGEGANALKVPERLYSTIFKNTKNDMIAELRSDAIINIQKTDPDLYTDLVKQGIIKVQNGQPIVNTTLAEDALERGLKGNVGTMANQVVTGQLKSEQAARQIASNYKGTVDLPEEQYQNVLKGLAQEYEDVGFGEITKEANKLAAKLAATKGKLPAADALDIRRFLDRVRIARSFNQPATKLSLDQANLKTLADTARTRVNAVPGMQPVMNDYSFYIDALEALAKEAARTGNNQVISLIDSMFLAGTAVSGNPLPAGAGLLRRLILTSPKGLTNTAQKINTGVLSPSGSGVLGSLSSSVAGLTQQ